MIRGMQGTSAHSILILLKQVTGFNVQGVSVIQRAKDACKWAQFIFFCCSYDECRQFLRSPGVHQALKGKCVVQLCSGTPEDANQMATRVQQLGATYLDAVILV